MKRHNDSLFGPSDEQDLELKAMHKGIHFSFISEIIGKYQILPHITEEEKSESTKAHFMLYTFDIFEGSKQTVDYHIMFDIKYFLAYMVMLLDTLEERGVHNVVVVMDNAKYYRTLPEGTPQMSWKINSSSNTCCLENIPTHKNDMKSVLW